MAGGIVLTLSLWILETVWEGTLHFIDRKYAKDCQWSDIQMGGGGYLGREQFAKVESISAAGKQQIASAR